jgi:hypothetical protein
MSTDPARLALKELLADVESARMHRRYRGSKSDVVPPPLAHNSDVAWGYIEALCQRGLAEPAKSECRPWCGTGELPPRGEHCFVLEPLERGGPFTWFDTDACRNTGRPAVPPIDGDRAAAEAGIWAEVSREARNMSRTVPCPIERTAMVIRCADALAWLLNIDARAKEGG